jgi:hypothetical protein
MMKNKKPIKLVKIVDSGARQHMTIKQEWFITYQRISPKKVFMGDDIVLEVIGKGSIKATMQVGGKLSHATITQVLHVPKMKNSFIFVSKLSSEGFKVEFDKDGYKVNDARGFVVAEARRDKNLYFLNVKVHKDMGHITNSLDESAMLWHKRFGHLNMASLKELDAMVDGMNLKKISLQNRDVVFIEIGGVLHPKKVENVVVEVEGEEPLTFSWDTPLNEATTEGVQSESTPSSSSEE